MACRKEENCCVFTISCTAIRNYELSHTPAYAYLFLAAGLERGVLVDLACFPTDGGKSASDCLAAPAIATSSAAHDLRLGVQVLGEDLARRNAMRSYRAVGVI